MLREGLGGRGGGGLGGGGGGGGASGGEIGSNRPGAARWGQEKPVVKRRVHEGGIIISGEANSIHH